MMTMRTANTSDFYFNPATRAFTGEISELRGLIMGKDFTFVSEWTRRAVTATYVTTRYDREGDIIEWVYSLGNLNFVIHIYND